MKNKDVFDLLKAELKENKIEIYDVKFSSTYFVFDMGKDACVSFRVQGLKNWVFGCWISREEEKPLNLKLDVFAQYERFIDKFKPSYSDIAVEVRGAEVTNDVTESYLSNAYEVVNVIRFMKKHQATAFVYGLDITLYRGEWYARWKMLREIVADEKIKLTKKWSIKAIKAISAIAGKLGLVSVAYIPDPFNGEPDHFNDEWLVLANNRAGAVVANLIERIGKGKYFEGSVLLYGQDERGDWILDAYDRLIVDNKVEVKLPVEAARELMPYVYNGAIIMYGEW